MADIGMLTIKRPTATTVLYTVSTRSSATTWIAWTWRFVGLLLRITVGAIFAILLAGEWSRFSRFPFNRFEVISVVPGSYGESALRAFEALAWPYRLWILSGLGYAITSRSHTTESLLVIRGLGIQTSTSSPSLLWSSSTRFIPSSSIQDVFIHEAFKGFSVKYYLSIVVEGEESVVVVFPVRCTLDSQGRLQTDRSAEHSPSKSDTGTGVARHACLFV